MTDLFAADEAATPLADEEKEGLIPSWISFRHELNAVEQENILQAERWAFTPRKRDIASEKAVKELHKRMFGKVWRWAGQFRKTARNIGVDSWRISSELRILLDDTRYWMTNGTYEADEVAARFHHRMVWIHPFPNGNGRHARLASDVLLFQMGRPRFSWGSKELLLTGDMRSQYVNALKAADGGDYKRLLAFVRA